MAHRILPQEHVRRVIEIHGTRLRVVDHYVDAHTKIRYECPRHGRFWAAPKNVVTRRSGCRRCYEATVGPRCRKTHAVYTAEARAVGIRVIDRYVTALTPIRHRCAKGHTWSTSPNQLLSGYGCPLCDRSQFRRRPVRVGNREVMLQGSEGVAVALMLAAGVDPDDLAFTTAEGRPTFRYRFDGRVRVYVPDAFQLSVRQVIEVKSAVTLGLYDSTLFAQVKAKARAVVAAGLSYRLMVIHRKQNIDIGSSWFRWSWRTLNTRFRRKTHAQDRRSRRKRRS